MIFFLFIVVIFLLFFVMSFSRSEAKHLNNHKRYREAQRRSFRGK